MDKNKTYLEIKEISPRKCALTNQGIPQGIYSTRNLALIAAYEIAIRTFPDEHPERLKYAKEIERLKG
jgi:hypothetical protein